MLTKATSDQMHQRLHVAWVRTSHIVLNLRAKLRMPIAVPAQDTLACSTTWFYRPRRMKGFSPCLPIDLWAEPVCGPLSRNLPFTVLRLLTVEPPCIQECVLFSDLTRTPHLFGRVRITIIR
jgi:hypothetical protein